MEDKTIKLLHEGKVEKAFTKLYKYFPKVEKHVCINSGSKEEALDIYQEALVLFYRKVTSKELKPGTSPEGFLVKTSKLLWNNELRKKKRRQGKSAEGLSSIDDSENIQEKIQQEEQYKIVEKILHQIGEKCKSILTLFYFESLSMDKIAKRFGYKTVQSAKVQKYKCMENARKLVLEHQSKPEND